VRPQSTLVTKVETPWDPLSRGHELGRRSALREVIGRQSAQSCFLTHGESLRAVVLTGSLARHEATLIEGEKGWHLLGDVEFLLIFHTRAPLPSKAAMSLLRQNIETAISRLGIAGEVSLSAAHPKYLRSLRPHIFAYELRNCGKVVGGDSEILVQIPSFSATDIPLEDGWQLLSNRMIEQLEALEGPEQRPKVLSRHLLYRTIKLYLDRATSFLLFAGEYAPSYAERARRLHILADTQPEDDKAPFDLHRFSDRVSECTQWKLSENNPQNHSSSEPATESDFSWCEEAVVHARKLWRWELARLVGSTREISNHGLMERWMKCRPASRRLRGWLFVLRKEAWHRSWKNWPRWARLGWYGSPRDWTYAAACELFFQLPSHLEPAGQVGQVQGDCERAFGHLPVIRHVELDPKAPSKPNWHQAAAVVRWNYRRFLEETRS
jgi:hypothetical protein